MNDDLVSVMTFADDFVVITEESSCMTLAIEECQKFLTSNGLLVNVGKCFSLRVLPVKGKKSMKVISQIHRWWGKLTIPSLNFEKLQKYLGVFIRHDGKISLPRAEWTVKLERLGSCHLNPIQKVQVIRQSICSFVLF